VEPVEVSACDAHLLQTGVGALVEDATQTPITSYKNFLCFLSYSFPGLRVIEWFIDADIYSYLSRITRTNSGKLSLAYKVHYFIHPYKNILPIQTEYTRYSK
jgi:hypothetical protein